MAGKNKNAGKKDAEGKIAAQNRRARFDYTIEDVMEAGIVLTGTEVKSLRTGQASIAESYAGVKSGEIYLFNAHIPEYIRAHVKLQHEVRRPRKLLLHGNQMSKLVTAVSRKGITLVPLSIYFNKRGIAKVELAVASGKRKADKRDTIKKREWQKEKSRLLKTRD
jgi:SsrA-binding protein